MMKPTGAAKEYRRVLAVQWADEGVKQSVIAERLGVTQGCVSQWVKRAHQGGKEALKTKPFPGHPPKLPDAAVPLILKALEELGPEGFGYEDQRWTTQRIADAIATLTKIQYSQSHMSKLLRRWGWSWQKPKRRDIRRDETAITHWQQQIWPALKKTGEGTE